VGLTGGQTSSNPGFIHLSQIELGHVRGGGGKKEMGVGRGGGREGGGGGGVVRQN